MFGFLHTVDPNGSPFVYGVSYGSVDLGGGKVSGGGTNTALADGYIGRYGPGVPRWIARIVGPGEDKIVGSALGVGSTIYAGGWFESTTSFNGRMLTSAGGRDLFLARFNIFTGAVDLTRTYGGTGRDEISSAASNAGELVLAGMFDETPSLVPPNTLAFGGTGPHKLAARATAFQEVRMGTLELMGCPP